MSELLEKALTKAGETVAALLVENTEAIAADVRSAILAQPDSAGGKAKRFKYRIGATIVIEPQGTECGVKAKISYGAKKGDESDEFSVSNDIPLPGMGEK